jgi:hypothetical protein
LIVRHLRGNLWDAHLRWVGRRSRCRPCYSQSGSSVTDTRSFLTNDAVYQSAIGSAMSRAVIVASLFFGISCLQQVTKLAEKLECSPAERRRTATTSSGYGTWTYTRANRRRLVANSDGCSQIVPTPPPLNGVQFDEGGRSSTPRTGSREIDPL